MSSTRRRTLLKMMAASPIAGHGVLGRGEAEGEAIAESELVKFTGDGLSLSPSEAVDVLQRIVDERGIEADYYTRGGVVEELETTMATALGKERAIYFPTGTLANHVAVRTLAGHRTRAIVPHESHLYNDSGDCAQQLSQMNLVPLGAGRAMFTLPEVEEIVERTESGRVTTGVGALMIESPVRRKLGELFDVDDMKKICDYARAKDIGTHLDGARLYMAAAYTGISPKQFASHFDTVYVSLWKYFNSGSGAILAGSKALVEPLYHTRRMFGSGLPAAWPFAALALHYFSDFESELRRAVATAEALFARLDASSAFRVERIPNGSNIVKLIVAGTDLDRFRESLRARGIIVSTPREEMGGFVLNVNPTLNRSSADELAERFERAL